MHFFKAFRTVIEADNEGFVLNKHYVGKRGLRSPGKLILKSLTVQEGVLWWRIICLGIRLKGFQTAFIYSVINYTAH